MLTIKERNIREGLGSSKFAVVHPSKGEIFFSGYRFECDAFILGYNMSRKEQEQKQAERDLWTNYGKRFEVMEKDGFFYTHDHATGMILGSNLFKTELEAEENRDEFIQYEKEQERYYNQSGR
jgi:hypothetical protein